MRSKKLRKPNRPRAKNGRKGAVKSVAAPQPLKLITGGKAVPKIRPETVQRARTAVAKPTVKINPFEVYMPPPGVLPKGEKPIAMDSAMTQSQINWANQSIGVYWQEGLTFLGYAYLSELTLRPEYRTISQVIATEMTRKWIKLQAVSEAEDQEVPDSKIPPKEPKAPFPPQFGAGDAAPEDEEEQDRDQAEAGEADPQENDQEEAGASFDPQAQETGEVDAPGLGHNQGPALDDKSEKIKELEDELDRLHVRDIFYKLAELDGWMGRAHLYIDTGATDDPVELKTDLGDGRNEATKGKFKKGMLERLTVVEPVWTYPQNYNSNDPLKPDWYNPTQWFVMGKQLHASRLLTFVGRPVPDILKPAYAFGGLSLSQIAKPYVDNWLQTRASVNDIIRAFSVMVVATDLTARLQNGDDDLFARIDLFNALRDNRGTFVIDKEGEDFKNVSAPLSSLDKLQAQAQEHMGSITRIPLVKLLGISPAGLNASSEGELKTFYDTINAFQETFFRPHLTKVIHFAMMNLWGEIDEEITFKFEDLWAMTEKEQAEVEKIRAETGDILINGSNAITPAEERKRVANTAETPYEGLDVENVPEPPEQPMLGGEGGEKGLGLTGHKPFQGGETGESAEQNAKEAAEAGDDRIIPFGEDAQWNESDHPRNEDGEFSSTGGGGGSSSKAEGGASSGGTEHAATAGTKLIKLIKNDPFLGKHATSDDYYGNAAVRKEKDGSVSVSMRDVGKWVNPPDTPKGEEDDYDWQVPTPESVTKLKQLVAKAEKDLGVKIEISGGEKNWTTFRIKPSAAPKAAAKPAAMPTLDPKTLKKVGPQMGSNPGGVYQNKQGEMFHVKQGRSPAHVRNEALAARLYGLTGASTLEYLNAGKNHIATRLEKLDKKRVKDLSPDEIKAAQKDFVTHAWLANWDAAGLGGDNIGTIKGKPVSLDLGGALEYRARGAPKGQAFGNTVGELKTLRDPKMNPDAAAVFGGMSKADLEASARPVLAVPDQEIRKAVEFEGESPELAQKLIARKRDIAKSLGLSSISSDQAAPGEGGLPGQSQGRSARPGAQDAWNEADHPRVPSGEHGGEFTKGGGGGGSTPGEQGIQAAKAEGKTGKAKEALELAAQNILEISGQSGAEVASEVPAQLWAEQKFAAAKTLNLSLAEATDLLTPEEHAALSTSEFETPEGLWDYIAEEEEQVAEYEKEQTASAKAESKGGAYAGQYVTGGTPEQNHKATVDKVLTNPTQKGIHYRRMLAKLIKESKQFGTGEVLQDALTKKLGDALVMTHSTLMKKGKTAEAEKVAKTLAKMGLAPSMTSVGTAPAPAKKATPQVKAPAGSAPLGLPSAPETPELAPPTKPTGKATQSELNAAKKASAYYPAPTTAAGKKIAAEFNEKYQNKQLTDPAALEQKVADYKETKAKIEKAEQAAVAEAQKKAQAEAAAQAVKQAEEAKKQAEANKQIMKDLGINEQEAVGFNALAQMIGGKKADVVKSFQHYEEEAKSLGYPITGFQAALIKNYSGSGYAHINPHLRNGSWTEAQHVYVKMVNNALKKMPTYKGICRRGTSLSSEHQAKYKVGHIVPENAFMSTTTKGQGFSGNTKYVITAIGKRGASIKQLSSHPSENEVLFAARTFFKVTKVEGSPGGNMTVHLEEMDDD